MPREPWLECACLAICKGGLCIRSMRTAAVISVIQHDQAYGCVGQLCDEKECSPAGLGVKLAKERQACRRHVHRVRRTSYRMLCADV